MLGNRIACLRTELGWSQAELARRLGISPSAVGMYEQGRREPSLDILMDMSRVFAVSTEFLITGHTISRQDQNAQMRLSGIRNNASALIASLKVLTREELLVLITAELFDPEAPGE